MLGYSYYWYYLNQIDFLKYIYIMINQAYSFGAPQRGWNMMPVYMNRALTAHAMDIRCCPCSGFLKVGLWSILLVHTCQFL